MNLIKAIYIVSILIVSPCANEAQGQGQQIDFEQLLQGNVPLHLCTKTPQTNNLWACVMSDLQTLLNPSGASFSGGQLPPTPTETPRGSSKNGYGYPSGGGSSSTTTMDTNSDSGGDDGYYSTTSTTTTTTQRPISGGGDEWSPTEESTDNSNMQWSPTEFTLGNGKDSKNGKVTSGQLIFADEFDHFDLETWQHEICFGGGNGNWEFQLYTNNRSNSFTRDGKLHIQPTLTADKFSEEFLSNGAISLLGGGPAQECTSAAFYGCERIGTEMHYLNPVVSARMRTYNSFAFKYGKVEIRAKLPKGNWLWPYISLSPLRNQYGNWPASGEIDMLESRGNAKLFDADSNSVGVEQFRSRLRFAPFLDESTIDKHQFSSNSYPDMGFDKEFHVYGMEWTPDAIKFSLDGQDFGGIEPPSNGFWEVGGFHETSMNNPWIDAENKKMAPFDQKFYLTIALAVGGTSNYFNDDYTGSPKPWNNTSPQAMKDFWNGREYWLPTWEGTSALIIDYIRVYAI